MSVSSKATALRVALALVALNLTLTFVNVWPTPTITWSLLLSVELAAAVFALTVLHRSAVGMARVVWPLIWLILIVGRYADVTAPALYGRPFNLYWDLQHLGNVTGMLGYDVPWGLVAAVAGSVFLGAAILFVAVRTAFVAIARAVQHPGWRHGLRTAAILVILACVVSRFTGVPPPTQLYGAPVTFAYARQLRTVLATSGPDGAAPQLAATPAALEMPLDGLNGADVIVMFLESYGVVAFDDPEMAAAVSETRAAMTAAVQAHGWTVVSARSGSPTFGGSSWLAHLTLLSGVEVRDPYAYAALMTQTRDTLPKAFGRAGYRTIGLLPGMRQAWPEGAFYGYDVLYGRTALSYPGPQFGWWGIPDQYTLAKLDALERSGTPRAPVFVVFPTSTTHTPFGPVPPYQPDWSRILSASAFEPNDVQAAMRTVPELTNLRPSYARAMNYMHETLAGYLREQAGRNLILVVIGDHQPPAAVSGRGAPWEVPVHVFTHGQTQVPDRLRAQGFQDGLTPTSAALGPMHGLVPMLFSAFSRDHTHTLDTRHQSSTTTTPSAPSRH